MMTSSSAIPEGEYFPLVNTFRGQVIRISPTSNSYINPMDINLNYSDDDNPLALKSDFILSLCELIVGGRDGLQPIEKTIIDRAVHIIYQPYLSDPRPENIPILEDLYNALREQEEKEAQTLATALEIYVTGLPERVQPSHQRGREQPAGLLRHQGAGQAAQEAGDAHRAGSGVGPRHRQPRRGQIHPVLHGRVPLAAQGGADGSVLRGNLEEVPQVGRHSYGHHAERQRPAWPVRRSRTSFENSDYIYMLNQAAGDREILAKKLGISPHQLSYVTQSGEGEGLLFYGNVILPFQDRFPKNTRLYGICIDDEAV